MTDRSSVNPWFSFEGRYYLLRLLVLLALLGVGYCILYLGVLSGLPLVALLMAMPVVVIDISVFSLVVRRLHDLNLSGWWSLALGLTWLIPGFGPVTFLFLTIWTIPFVIGLIVLSMIPGRARAPRSVPTLEDEVAAERIEHHVEAQRDQWIFRP